MRYAAQVSRKVTPQRDKARAEQVKNSAGGYTFQLDDFGRLDRFLVLGNEGGTYYAGEQKLTKQNAACVERCLKSDYRRTIDRIVEMSDSGRIPKNGTAIFALALAASCDDREARRYALSNIQPVCRTASHLFEFVEACSHLRGWGRGLRNAVSHWYRDKETDNLSYQMVKYQNRNGWSHRDVMRLAHIEPRAPGGSEPKHDALFRWVMGKPLDKSYNVLDKQGEVHRIYAAVQTELPRLCEGYDHLKRAESAKEVVGLINEYRFTHEMIPSQFKNDKAVWEALLQHMPVTALIRNLGKLSNVGLLVPLSQASKLVAGKLTDVNLLRKGRVHPIQMLSALRTYSSGRGVKGSLTWTPVQPVVAALDDGFYASFQAIEPTGKNILVALDVSASMESGNIAGVPGLTPREASAALAMVTLRTEQNYHVVGFTSNNARRGSIGDWWKSPTGNNHWSLNNGLSELSINAKQSLKDVCSYVGGLPMGGTDCSLPMLYAAEKNLDVDCFQVLTDNETWAGNIHPFQALKQYRKQMGKPEAKLVVMGMTATQFTIADPSDPGMLDIVGFDAAGPQILSEFIRG